MNYKLAFTFIIASLIQPLVFGQIETYTIKKTLFSSDKYDEFSPVYYKNGIVFTTNRNLSLLNYSTPQNKGLFKINFIDTTGNQAWTNAKLFSKELTTKLNDGPATFSSRRDTIFYSRNLENSTILRDISSPRNRLGIFYAVLDGNKWTKIREFRINNEWYNVTTPCLSPDGKRLYFASDKPGGYGGSDLYYCLWKDGYWNDPVNLGPNINTKGNEAYPFITSSGELLFSSDGHPGFGGKDTFFSRFSDTTWLAPVHLDAPVNSPSDDFGLITDSLMNTGYFSSNRDGSIDIFQFRTNSPQIFYSTLQRENQLCFLFSDSGTIVIDTLNLEYVWDFGDGKKAAGAVVKHCFPGTGKYNVRLDIVERSTGNLFFTKLYYNLEIRDIEQPYITSPDVSVAGEAVDFDALKSYLPGYKILSYAWDFGDGTRAQGDREKHSYKEQGEYMVNLGLTLKSDLTGKIRKAGSSKKLTVLSSLREKQTYEVKTAALKPPAQDIRNYDNAFITISYSAEAEFSQEAVFQVELISSKTKIDLKDKLFSTVPKKYVIEEIYDPDSGIYRYVADRQMSLMATYYAYQEISDAGYKNVRTRIEVLKDPAEKELNNIKKIYGTMTESYFDSYDKLTSNAYIMLDQVVKFMNKYPSLRLEVAVHSDNKGTAENNLAITQRRSQMMANFLVSRGINIKRVVAVGFGGSKPIATNLLEKERKINQRIDFRILN